MALNLLEELRKTKEETEEKVARKTSRLKPLLEKCIKNQEFSISEAMERYENKCYRNNIMFKISIDLLDLSRSELTPLICDKLVQVMKDVTGIKDLYLMDVGSSSAAYFKINMSKEGSELFETAITTKMLHDTDSLIQEKLLEAAADGINNGRKSLMDYCGCSLFPLYDRHSKWLKETIEKFYESRGISLKLNVQEPSMEFAWK